MPSVLQAPLNHSVGFMLKEKAPEPILSGFTAVNVRASPPSPPTSNGTNGMTTDGFHVRPVSRNTTEPVQEHQDSLPRRDVWRGTGLAPGPHGLPLTNGQANGHPNGHYSSSSSPVDNGSPNSPGKRKRSSSAEGAHSPNSQDGAVRRRLDSYTSIATNGSPISQGQPGSMDHSQQQALPPIDRAEHERNWQSRESQDGGHGGYPDQQPRDPRSGDAPQEPMNPNSAAVPQPMGTGDSQMPLERSSTLEITRAGVLVDPKKRKRQFANRTKTGCGTCRRRKKKCDEAKPECNNCLRGSFICEGYANKVPWPKNNPNKPQPLQSKDQFPINPSQLYHNHGTNREGYPPDPNGHAAVDGAQARPIVVEEHDRQPAGRNGWGGTWGEPPRGNYPADHHRPTEYPHPPSMQQPHPRPPSNDHHAPHPTQGPPPQRQHNPRIYHHTQQTMSQNVKSSPAATAEAALQHQSQQQQQQQQPQQQPHQQQPQMHPAQPHTNGPPGPPPPHYQHPPPPKPEKSEKDKMLSGEPFQPYSQQLCEDRERARQLCYRYNQTTNQHVEIGREEVGRICRAIFGATYRSNPHNPNQRQGFLGREVQVDTPFYCDYGYNIVINDRVAIEANCKFLDSGKITIGHNCTIEANVTISTKKVPNDIKAMKGTRGSAIAADVVIGDNVWIGANSTIHAGVKIGTGAIIYPGSVVTRDIPRDVAVRGNPAEIHMVGWDEH